MISIASLIILCAIGIGALLLVNLANRQQARAKKVRHRLTMLRFRFDALDELTTYLDQLVDSRAIARRVYDEALRIVAAMQELEPQAAHTQANLSYAQRRANELADSSAPRQLNRLKETDAQVAGAQQVLREAGRILRQQNIRGEISNSELETYLNELAWLAVYIEITSLVGRGMVSMQRGDVLGAFELYRRAQAILLRSEERDPRRTQLIKELNEMIGKKRLALSASLMPEAAQLLLETKQNNPLPVQNNPPPANASFSAENNAEKVIDSELLKIDL